MRIVCQADSGSFTFSFRGVASADISFNASYGYVKNLLEDMDTVTEVDVSMSSDGAAVCGQDFEVVTRVEFTQDFGSLPAALVRCSKVSQKSTYACVCISWVCHGAACRRQGSWGNNGWRYLCMCACFLNYAVISFFPHQLCGG